MRRTLLPTFILSVLSPTVYALEVNPDNPFAGKIDLGYVSTSGNTDAESTKVTAEVSYQMSEFWTTGGRLEGYVNKDEGETNAERYFLSWNNRWKLTEKSYVFNDNEYEDDRFSGYDYQAATFVGYGYSWWNSDESQFDTGVGLGYRHSELDTGEEEDEAVVRGTLYYRKKLSDSAKFTQELTVDVGQEKNIARSKSKLSSILTDKLSLNVAVDIEYTSDVPPEVEKTDRITSVSLSYEF